MTIVAVLAAGCASGSGLTGLGGAGGDVTTSQRNFVLIPQDAAPWETAHNQGILTFAGIPFDIMTSAQFAANPTMLYNYKVVIIAGDQPTMFYTTVAANNAALETYVNRGGRLDYHAAFCGWNEGLCTNNAGSLSLSSMLMLPFGLAAVLRYDEYNDVVLNTHQMAAGVPDPFWGSYASHGYMTGVSFTTIMTEASFNNGGGGSALVTNGPGNGPTLVVREVSSGGRMVASTQPLEYGCENGEDTGTIFENMYMWSTGRIRNVNLSAYCAIGNGDSLRAVRRSTNR